MTLALHDRLTHSAAVTERSQPPRMRSGIANPLDSRRRIHAVLFDLDGTLYRQRPMRAFMAIELLMLAFAHPFRAPRTWRALATYRQAQEIVRSRLITDPRAQLEIAADRSGLKPADIEQIVGEWMFERPLKYLPTCRAAGLLPLIAFLESQTLELGVLSDYPAEAKLRALGLEGRFSAVACSTDPEIGALKPHPRGFLTVCDRWQMDPSEVLVVGDRMEVDAAGATAAGMPCVIIGRASTSPSHTTPEILFVPSLERLRYVLSNCC